ncbi:hypothetical protein M0813_19415 [Anaeramoeba flamelloides]|uniref:EF-hand domain-containing protein n=1 Tax=Anaeramoeba flamelloides TaxID=1746091 RepID=A0ABQ8YNU5_9EUKA|nr:hypothetical protein M0813_19415 [Anaeramoeba flamelloides]
MTEKTEKPKEVNRSAGELLFTDVFRRADKDDNGEISYEEFIQYFSDSVLKDEELQELFKLIDIDSNGVLDIEEICKFFLEDFKDFKPLFDKIEDLSISIGKALHSASKDYPNSDKQKQFKIRLYLREMLNSLFALGIPVQRAIGFLGAMDKTDEIVNGLTQLEVQKIMMSKIHKDPLSYQVDRLSNLLDRVEVQGEQKGQELVKFYVRSGDGRLDEEKGGQHLVCFTHYIETIKEKEFLDFYSDYQSDLVDEESCYYLFLRKEKPKNDMTKFIVYQIWDHKMDLDVHFMSEEFKEWETNLVDVIVKPSESNQMVIPKKWAAVRQTLY